MEFKLIRDIVEGSEIELWHGGGSYFYTHTIEPNKKNRWEYGPGLYLTTSFRTASRYRKKKLYRVKIKRGADISKVSIPVGEVEKFIKKNAYKKAHADLIARAKKFEKNGAVDAKIVNNLCISGYGINTGVSPESLRQFLVESGVDYAIVRNFGGSGETVVVVMNPDVIISARHVKPKEKITDFDVDFNLEG